MQINKNSDSRIFFAIIQPFDHKRYKFDFQTHLL